MPPNLFLCDLDVDKGITVSEQLPFNVVEEIEFIVLEGIDRTLQGIGRRKVKGELIDTAKLGVGNAILEKHANDVEGRMHDK